MPAFRYLARALQVTWICLRHLFAIVMDRILKRPGIAGPERLRIALEEIGGSFLKFGQILSLQIDLLPREYCDALLDLLDRVPPFSPEDVRKIFQEELGSVPETLFREFDCRPVASASIGQVHRAVLEDRTPVAVKVQRPRARQTFMRDATLLNAFVMVVFFLRIRTLYFLRDPVREFNDWIEDELDYRREASYADMLEKNAQQTPSEKVPRIYWHLTTARVLTMDFLRGYSVLEYLRLRAAGDQQRLQELRAIGFEPSIFVSNVTTNFVSDVLRFGVFHADLHPANLMILPNNVVGYVDFGIVGTLTSEARRKVIQLTLAFVRGKTEDIYSSFLDISTFTEDADLQGFQRELGMRSRSWYEEPAIGGIPRLGISFNLAMIDLLRMCRSYGLLPNREMIKYIRAVVLADGLVSRLAPGLDYGTKLANLCEDYIAGEIQSRIFSPELGLTFLADLSGWLQAGPGAMLRALERMERRQLKLRTHLIKHHDGQRGLRLRVLMAAIVWISMAVSAALNWHRLFGHNLLIAGYLAIGFLCGWTLWTIHLMRRLARST